MDSSATGGSPRKRTLGIVILSFAALIGAGAFLIVGAVAGVVMAGMTG